MIGARRPVQPGDIGQGAQAYAPARLHQGEAFHDEGAVEAGQRRYVRHGGQSDDIEAEQQVRRRSFAPVAALAQRPVERHQRDKHHACRAKRALPRHVVLPVGVDDDRLGQDFGGLVMVEHDDVEPEFSRLDEGLETGRAAIDRHQKRRAPRRQRPDRLAVGTVALGDAVRNVDQPLDAAEIEEFRQQRRGTGAVDIVIAKNGDGLARLDRPDQPLRRLAQGGERKGLRQQGAQGRIEIGLRCLQADAAPREDARQKVGQARLLGDGHGFRPARVVKPVTPGTTERRSLDAEQAARLKPHRH